MTLRRTAERRYYTTPHFELSPSKFMRKFRKVLFRGANYLMINVEDQPSL